MRSTAAVLMLFALSTLAVTTYAAKQKDATTFYWVAVEKESKGGAKDTWLRNCKKQNVAKVSKKFAKEIQMEGTGILEDGRTLNVMCRKQCNYNN